MCDAARFADFVQVVVLSARPDISEKKPHAYSLVFVAEKDVLELIHLLRW